MNCDVRVAIHVVGILNSLIVESTDVEMHLSIKLRGTLRPKSVILISHMANIWTESK